MNESFAFERHREPPEWIAHHPVTRELGPEAPQDLLAYRSEDHLQAPGSVDETGFSDGGVV